ncbi:CPBP family glutamic-type intramembrane protease [Flammeovirga aprica]|uniref:CPBP family intramembrane metalloprotease n=1 Tax=Flammeovirga aprica JL-4 TaxID=694437 RepID=A0A7X9RV86_9BACT|nr:CPBP family glutamic-type intramembrane protease [Flammeovirga aprica]NME69350.1 CPBP family intramembrane metalloprotease [Flammeovirga aprica JL-4]
MQYFKVNDITSLDKSVSIFLIIKSIFLFSLISLLYGIVDYLFIHSSSDIVLYSEMSYWEKLLLGSLWAPIVEEFAYRYFLDFKVRSTKISISLLLSFLLIHTVGFFFSFGNYNYLLFVGYFLCIFLIVDKLIKQSFVDKWKDLFIYISVFGFGISHITNFSLDQLSIDKIPYVICYVLTISIIGYIMTVIRLKFGMRYNIALHFVLNFLLFV